MPILPSSYKPPYLFRNCHVSTIFPNLFRKIKDVKQTKERLELTDGDFLDFYWSYASKKTTKIAILIHGLEGNAQRQYILGQARLLNQNDFDTIAMNLRNCGTEPNRLFKSYHAGITEDIHELIAHILKNHAYTQLYLCGFSLGGNIVLKYLGEQRSRPHEIKGATAISSPGDLQDSLQAITKWYNVIYNKRFLKNLKLKLYQKQIRFPNRISKLDIQQCRSLLDIDNLYTSNANGYKDAIDYYQQCSNKQFLTKIDIPTLIINAQNDSFMGAVSYAITEANQNPNLYLEIPKWGGHVGFFSFGKIYYNEKRTLEFFNN